MQLRAGSRRWARSRCRCRSRRLVTERAGEFGHRLAKRTVKSASGNMHGVAAQHHRRGVEDEGDGEVIWADAVVVSRSSINRKIARLNSGWVNRFAKVDNKDSRLVEYHTGTGAGHRTGLCQRERDRADCQKHVNRAPKKVCL